MRRRQNDSLEPTIIILTPLIDVVFVVLVVFILIAPMIDIDTVALASSKGTQKSICVDQKLPLVISIDQKGKVAINTIPSSIPSLLSKLTSIKRANPDIVPLLLCDKRAPFGAYQEVKNHLEQAGYKQLDIALHSR